MSDESLREFQLNGKQLVFLFMASTTVAVVIFLCGVMVGRGVTAAQAAVASDLSDFSDPTTGVVLDAAPQPVTAVPSDTAPDTSGDGVDLKFAETLTAPRPKAALEAPSPPPSVKAPPVAPASVRTPAGLSKDARPAGPSSVVKPGPLPSVAAEGAEPDGTGFVVQVAATPRRTEADSIRNRLRKKGYPAFVTTSGRLFRIRVGKYTDRAEATKIAQRLESEERFKPWVTR